MWIEFLDDGGDGILNKVLEVECIDVTVTQEVEEIDEFGRGLAAGKASTAHLVEVVTVGLIDMYLVGHASFAKLDAYVEDDGYAKAGEKWDPVFFH
jgi:hypothetical protein